MSELSPGLSTDQVRKAVKLTYAQAMLGSIYVASTGGMFLIGYALQLGATDVQIGLMSTLPMLCIVFQLVSAALVERGVSRRGLTVGCSLVNVLLWGLIIAIPYAGAHLDGPARVWMLLSIVTLVTLFGFMAGNARGSWVGDLIPVRYRGTFFGRLGMYGSIIGTVFALSEGTFLDHVKTMGIGAFSLLFGFGVIFGLINTLLFVPQAEVRLKTPKESEGFWHHVRQTFANRQLMIMTAIVGIWSMQSIAGPFYAVYALRDLKMSFFGFGLLNAAAMLTGLVGAPFWGRLVDRYGCRPVLITCALMIAPFPLAWAFMTTPLRIYATIIPLNALSGFIGAGIMVSLNTMVYKVTPSAGRSVQFAIYSVIVVLVAAPLPTIGGYLPEMLRRLGIAADMRILFCSQTIFIVGSLLFARMIHEPKAHPAREFIRKLPGLLLSRGARRPADQDTENDEKGVLEATETSA